MSKLPPTPAAAEDQISLPRWCKLTPPAVQAHFCYLELVAVLESVVAEGPVAEPVVGLAAELVIELVAELEFAVALLAVVLGSVVAAVAVEPAVVLVVALVVVPVIGLAVAPPVVVLELAVVGALVAATERPAAVGLLVVVLFELELAVAVLVVVVIELVAVLHPQPAASQSLDSAPIKRYSGLPAADQEELAGQVQVAVVVADKLTHPLFEVVLVAFHIEDRKVLHRLAAALLMHSLNVP